MSDIKPHEYIEVDYARAERELQSEFGIPRWLRWCIKPYRWLVWERAKQNAMKRARS